MYLNGTTLHYAVGNTSQISGGTLATNTFYHVAVARNGGTTKLFLDGTEDNVKVPSDDDFGFGTSNWCLEAFIRPGSVTGIQRIFDLRDNSATDTAPTMYLDGTTLHYAVGNTSQISGGTLATNTFYHVAVARLSLIHISEPTRLV